MRITRYILKSVFVILVVVLPFYNLWQQFGSSSLNTANKNNPVKPGFYNVIVYKINHDTIPYSPEDSMRWQNVIFENNLASGSIKTADTIFRQRYKRGYFSFNADTVQHTISFKKLPTDSAMRTDTVLLMHYQIANDNSIQFWGQENKDSLYVLLKKSNRHFQLAEKQFHWLSEYNR